MRVVGKSPYSNTILMSFDSETGEVWFLRPDGSNDFQSLCSTENWRDTYKEKKIPFPLDVDLDYVMDVGL